MIQKFKAQIQSETAEFASVFDMNSKGGLQKRLPLKSDYHKKLLYNIWI